MNQNASAAHSPWKGLNYYAEEDEDLFFGRDREKEELLRLIQRGTLTVLFSRSGLGKSSLLRAGLSPLLRDQNCLPVLVRIDYAASGPHPVQQIVSTTLAAAKAASIEVEVIGDPAASPESGEWRGTLWEFFHRHRFWSARNDPVTPVLMLDQFEEIFTLGQQSRQADEFIVQLADLAENRMPRIVQSRLETTDEKLNYDTRSPNYKLIVALREDYVSRLDSLRPVMPAVMHNRYELTPLTAERALEVVVKAGGTWVTEAVAREIVAAVAGGKSAPSGTAAPQEMTGEVEPAYLSVMCDELYRLMIERKKHAIDASLVTEERGKILDAFYERSFASLQPATRVFVEERLLTHGGFRSSLPLAETKDEGLPASDLDHLIERRVLRREPRLGTTHVELSHDLLVPIVRKSRDARRAQAQAEAEREAERKRTAAFNAKLKREQRRLRLALGTVAVLVGTIGFFIYGWVLPYDVYCRDFTKRWGRAHPVGPLPEAAVAHRDSTYRLTSQGRFGKVIALNVVNARQEPARYSAVGTYLSSGEGSRSVRDQVARIEFTQNRKGHVVSEIAFDRFDRMIWGFVYVPHDEGTPPAGRNSLDPTTVIGNWVRRLRGEPDADQPRVVKAMFVGADGYPKPQGKSRAEFVEIRYDERGFETELRYQDREGRPMPGRDDAYGQRKSYDGVGREIRITSLDEKGQPTNDKVGNATFVAIYDRDGNLTEGRALDVMDEPTLVADGYYKITLRYDEWGRWIEQRYFNLSDKPVAEKESGAHLITAKYDDRGNMIAEKLFDTAENKTLAGGGSNFFDFPAHEQRVEFDSHNRPVAVAYFDTNGDPQIGNGWHSIRMGYDAQGFVSAQTYFDQNGDKVNTESGGFHSAAYVNDSYGQIVEERYFKSDGQPLAGDFHLRKTQYDRAGNPVVEAFFDGKEQPRLNGSAGVHRIEKEYDRFRNATQARYFDTENQPIESSEGFHRVVATYDDFGSELTKRWYARDEAPVPGPEGAHEVRKTYDERGLLTFMSYHGAGNVPAHNSNGIHTTIIAYDEKRQESVRLHYDKDWSPAEDKAGNHLTVNAYDERGRPISTTYLRHDRSPNLDTELGIATITKVYDKTGEWIEQAFYDADNNLVPGPYRYARARHEPQPDGRIATVYYGPDDKPAFNPLQGCAIKKSDGRTRGETILESYHDANGELMIGPLGYAELRIRWDESGQAIGAAYFGLNGTPVAGPNGYHRSEQADQKSDLFRFFAADGRELTVLDSDTAVPVISATEIINIKQVAARIGIQIGDIVWRYGEWFYPDALEAELAKDTEFSLIAEKLRWSFLGEKDRLSEEQVRMTVIRRGEPVEIIVPPLPDKNLGMSLDSRMVPVETFETWKAQLRRAVVSMAVGAE